MKNTLKDHKVFLQRTLRWELFFSPQRQKAPPPNFKAVKLEDIISEFGDFFVFLNTFADTIRNMAGEVPQKQLRKVGQIFKRKDQRVG